MLLYYTGNIILHFSHFSTFLFVYTFPLPRFSLFFLQAEAILFLSFEILMAVNVVVGGSGFVAKPRNLRGLSRLQ